MEAITIGTAQDGGWPQLGGPPTPVNRTAASLLVRTGEGSLLVDASLDLRAQYAALLDPGLRTRVVLTHLNHSNPAGISGSKEEAAVRAAGMEVATDMAAYGP